MTLGLKLDLRFLMATADLNIDDLAFFNNGTTSVKINLSFITYRDTQTCVIEMEDRKSGFATECRHIIDFNYSLKFTSLIPVSTTC